MIPEFETSTLEQWSEEGTRIEPEHSNIVTYVSPDERFRLEVQHDDPVEGYLVEMYHIPTETRLGRAIHDDQESAGVWGENFIKHAERYLTFVEGNNGE